MALAVVHTGGVTGGSTSDSWSSTATSLIVAIGHFFDNSSAPNDGDVTDSHSNAYTLVVNGAGGAGLPGVAIWYNNNGTRGAAHTVDVAVAGVSDQNNSIIEITGQDLTSAVFDTTTDATGTDSASPYDVTAAAAISGNQIAIYGVTLDASDNVAWGQPSGYSNIRNVQNGTASLVSAASYKINETGTPTVGATRTGSATAREAFATFKEVAAAGDIIVAWITA